MQWNPARLFDSRTVATAAVTLALAGFGCGEADIGTEQADSDVNQTTDSNQTTGPTNDDSSEGSNAAANNGDYAGDEAPPNQTNPDRHEDFGENEYIDTGEEDTSTFSTDVNTASYTIARRDLLEERLPTPEGVRTEEFINFFRFDYPQPEGDQPFSINTEVAPSHFGSTDEQERHMMRIGLRGKEVTHEEMKPTNLVFLVDSSGSMDRTDRLPLAKESLHTLLDHLRPSDSVGIQTYASGSETVLSPTAVENKDQIKSAIDSLQAGGSTNGEGGIVDAYDMAEEAFIDGGNNRVVIVTDGDFNVGKTGEDLVELVKDRRDREISLTSVGYGINNDDTMEKLARKGNGNYFYVDVQQEAERIFGDELPSTIEVIARDVRAQVQFDADVVDRYRLVGYEKRVMDNDEFDDEDTNAGEIGPGHTVTAFYEMELHDDYLGDDLGDTLLEGDDQIAEVAVRHKEQYGEETIKNTRQVEDVVADFQEASDGFRFATAVAEFAEILRESEYSNGADFDEVHSVAENSMYEDDDDQDEFLQLVTQASDLWPDDQ